MSYYLDALELMHDTILTGAIVNVYIIIYHHENVHIEYSEILFTWYMLVIRWLACKKQLAILLLLSIPS